MSAKAITRATAAFLTLSLLVAPLTAMSQVVPPMPGASPAPTQAPSGGPPVLPSLIAPPQINPSRQPRALGRPVALHLVPINVRFLQAHPALRTMIRRPLAPERMEYIQRPPIAFRPLTLHDLPGSPETANTLIRIPVPGGLYAANSAGRQTFRERREGFRMVRAGTYLEAMNRIERAMNRSGYTLRARPAAATSTTIGGQPGYELVVGRLRFNHALLDRQIRSFRALQHPLLAAPRFRDLKTDIHLLNMVSHHQLTIEKLPQKIRGPLLVHQLHYYPNLRPLGAPTASPVPSYTMSGRTTFHGGSVNPYAHPSAAALTTPNPLAGLPSYPGTFSWDYPLNKDFGDPNSVDAYLNFDFQLDGDISKGADGSASADTGITLFNNPFDIFSAKAQFQGTDPSVTSATITTSKGVDSASINILLGGNNVWSKSAKADWNNSSNPWTESETFVSITVPIPIMPGLNVAFSAAVAGTLGLAYNVALEGIGVAATVTPSAGLTASFAVALSIDAVVASISAGVEGNLSVLTFSVDLIGAADLIGLPEGPAIPAPASLGTPPAGMEYQEVPTQLAFQYSYQINDTLTTLSGSVDIFAQECILWGCAKQTVPLFSFKGVTLESGTIAGGPSWTNVNIGGPFLKEELVYPPAMKLPPIRVKTLCCGGHRSTAKRVTSTTLNVR
ncbi:MAG: hypothetical protein ACYDEW_07025 [Vulcanimicrobiaceae bacterium]